MSARFGLLVSSNCPPYETEYVNSKFTFQRSNTLADMAGFYRAFGLETSPIRNGTTTSCSNWNSWLIWSAWNGRRLKSARHVARAPADLPRCPAAIPGEHLAWWAPAFAHLLTRQNPGGFYEAAGTFLAALIPAERSLLGVPVPTLARSETDFHRSTRRMRRMCTGDLIRLNRTGEARKMQTQMLPAQSFNRPPPPHSHAWLPSTFPPAEFPMPVGEAKITPKVCWAISDAHVKHRRPDRAVSLLDYEIILDLTREGFLVWPGRMGENLTVVGVDVQHMSPGHGIDDRRCRPPARIAAKALLRSGCDRSAIERRRRGPLRLHGLGRSWGIRQARRRSASA